MNIVRDGSGWKATSLTQRQNNDDLGGAVKLKGRVVWPVQSNTLRLREVSVSATAEVINVSCAAVRAGDAVYLEITAQRTEPGQALRATQVQCSPQAPANAVVEVSGTLQSYTPDASGTTGTLVVTNTQGTTQTFKWTAQTLLPRNLAQALNSRVEVEYQTVNGENRLRKIKLDESLTKESP